LVAVGIGLLNRRRIEVVGYLLEVGGYLPTSSAALVPTARRPPLTAATASLVAVGLLFSLLVVAFSWAIATFPGEWQEAEHWDRPMWAVNALFNGPDDLAVHRFPFSNTLVLEGLNVYEGVGINDPEKAKWRDVLFHAAKRDLRGAIFDPGWSALMSWEKFTSITDRFFPSIRILHPLPCHRFDARTRGTSPVR
jgi:hypothetical protein